MTSSDDDYTVGYGKPPANHQFQKGASRNPQGRPKGHKNLKTDLTEELGELVTLREGSQARRMTKQRAMLKAMIAKAAKWRPTRF